MKLKVEYIPIDSIKPYENNAKIHTPEQIEQIKASINEFGMNDPIGIWGNDNLIVEGHGRLMACKELGYKEVPIIRLDELTDDQRKAYTLIHNQTTMNTGFDIDILNEELANIEFDMSDFGFELEIDDIEEEKEIVEDEVPEIPEEPKAKLGDIYQLGNHRLMCGDSTSVDDVNKLINNENIDLLLTDPPYGIKADKGTNGFGNSPQTVKKYNDEWDDFSPTKETFDLICSLSKYQIIFGGNYFTDKLPIGTHWIVWDKIGDIEFKNPFSDCELAWTNFKKAIVKKYISIQQGFINEDKEKRVHPTQKSIKLLCDILNDYTKENESILDCFGGSGSTLIACEQLNRKCYMMELDPHYVDVIIQRWENFTGEKAIKLNG